MEQYPGDLRPVEDSVLDKLTAFSILACLSERERQILDLRFGQEGETPTYAEIATKLGICKTLVHKTMALALIKIRAGGGGC